MKNAPQILVHSAQGVGLVLLFVALAVTIGCTASARNQAAAAIPIASATPPATTATQPPMPALLATGAPALSGARPMSCVEPYTVQQPSTTTPISGTLVYTYSVAASYPHDPAAFTQGLVYDSGVLYEGTGLEGRSSLRRVELATGKVLETTPLAPEYFGEGIALFGGKIYQLTWQSCKGFVYQQQGLKPIGDWAYHSEGWGLTHNGRELIMSDGSDRIFFLDPATLSVTHQLAVRDQGVAVFNLNELEYIDGEIFANVWQTNYIVRIDPQSGLVKSWIDLRGLLAPADILPNQPLDVLNGIAFDAAGRRLFVTGKLWPKLFQIELVPPTGLPPRASRLALPLIVRS